MAKQKNTQVVRRKNGGTELEQSQIIDVNYLPDPEEVERYYTMDPDILPWLKGHADKEQNFRHDLAKGQLTSARRARLRTDGINVFGMICSLSVILIGMAFSYYLIKEGMQTTGTIFAGGTILFGASLFTQKVKSSQKK